MYYETCGKNKRRVRAVVLTLVLLCASASMSACRAVDDVEDTIESGMNDGTEYDDRESDYSTEIGEGAGTDHSVNGTNNDAMNNGTTNNSATNNGATNNGTTNNGATNNDATNNGTTNNGTTNKDMTNNGTTDKDTTNKGTINNETQNNTIGNETEGTNGTNRANESTGNAR